MRRRVLPVAAWPAVGVAVLVGGVAATLSWQLRWHDTGPADTTYFLLVQRWWITALAGCAATVAVLLPATAGPYPVRRGGAAPLAMLPGALTAGLLTSALAGLATFAGTAALGSGRTVSNLLTSARMSMWLFLVAVLILAPGALLLVSLLARARPWAGIAVGSRSWGSRPACSLPR